MKTETTVNPFTLGCVSTFLFFCFVLEGGQTTRKRPKMFENEKGDWKIQFCPELFVYSC